MIGWSQMAIKWDGGGLDSDSGLSAGGLVEFGGGQGGFQTGLLLQPSVRWKAQSGRSGVLHVNIDYLAAIPLLAKVNFSGEPTRTVYLRGGLMPRISRVEEI